MKAEMYYNPRYFLLSLFDAFVLAYIAVYTQSRLTGSNRLTALKAHVIGSITLGLSVSSMHFIAMKATFFQPVQETVLGSFTGPSMVLVGEVILITLILLGFTIISSIVDRRMQEVSNQLAQSEIRFPRSSLSMTTILPTPTRHFVKSPGTCSMNSIRSRWRKYLTKSFNGRRNRFRIVP